ncbi:MAG: hypothetical protein IAI49_03760 [Candidatus Eremiobacteraeota bacterium]|nr:hypothetical protein [Candidatus Eremiobacteraeota bacterium]
MHNEDIERPSEHDDDGRRESVIAADDTGLVQQQETLHEIELGEGAEIGAP